ncbi:MAG: phospholipase D-like domain-containing protein [Burkholderiaceae bacterium]|nr:phospholipase D-like domain-containing protein [Burkholderiaceae bacterium]
MHWPLSLSPLEHGAFVFVGLLIYVMVTRIGQQHRHPSAAIARVMSIALLPYLGTPLFLIFGTRKLARARRRPPPRAPLAAGTEGPDWALTLLAALGVPSPVRNRSVAFRADGEASLRELVALIDGARERVDLSTFVLADDAVGATVSSALVRAAGRGLQVRVLLDAIGGLRTSRRLARELRAGGVPVRWFMPVLRNPVRGRTNLRNHRKLVAADGECVWSGGRNLAAEYFVDAPGWPAWRDLSFVVRGPLAAQAHETFDHDWAAAWGKSLRAARTAAPPPGVDGGPSAQLVPSGPDYADDTVHALLLASAYHARARILAVTPYFIPDDALLAAWCIACRRGVRLTLVVPKRSNHWMADWARERALRALAAAGAQVMLYPAMLHAKAVVVDAQLALCGSANLDGRSLFVNFELMTAFYGAEEIAWIAEWIDAQAQQSGAYEARAPSWGRDVLEGIVRSVGFQL